MLLRLSCGFAALAVAGLGLAQDWNPQGSITSRDVKIERRNGNVVEGTEFVHYEYRVSLREVPTGEERWKLLTACGSTCKGKKHKKHEECDLSCDEKCTIDHHHRLAGSGQEDKTRENQRTAESARLAQGIGMPGGPDNWSSATSLGIKSIIESAKRPIDVNFPHKNVPCTSFFVGFSEKKSNIEVRGEFWKVGYYMSRGVKSDINEMVSSHQGPVGFVYRVDPTPKFSDPWVICKCANVVQEPVKDPGKPIIEIPGRTPTFSGLGWRDKDGKLTIPEGVKISCVGESLNKATLICENSSQNDYVCEIPPGACCVPEDGGTQIMACVGGQTLNCPAGAKVVLQLAMRPDPVRTLLAQMSLKVACTELAKHQPSESTKFTLRPPTDEVLAQVCSIVDNSTFMASVVDQYRIWIYTDQATREAIGKRTLPGPTEGMYLRALYQLGTQGPVDLREAKYRKCLDPMLLTAATAGKEVTGWYVDLLSEIDPKGAYAAGVAKALQGKSERIDARHAAHLALAWTGSDNPELVKQGIALMKTGVPEAFRDAFYEEGGLDAIRNLLRSGTESDVLQGIDIATAWSAKGVLPSVQGLVEFGLTEGVRNKAAEAAKALG